MRLLSRTLLCLALTAGAVYADTTKSEKGKSPVAPLPEISMGRSEAPVVILEYSSLTCTHCAEFHKNVLPAIEKKYIKPGYVRLIMRDFPGDRIALMAHQIAWCQGKEKYLGFIKLFYATQSQWLEAKDPVKALKAIALKHGVTDQQFEACKRSTALMDKIIQGRLKAQKAYTIKNTPVLVMGATSKKPKIYQRSLSFKEINTVIRHYLSPTLKDRKDDKKL